MMNRMAREGSRMETVYGALWVAGTALPLSQFLPWVAEHGLDLRLFVAELFANRIAAFFAWDVIVAVVVLLVLVVTDRELPGRQRLGVAIASLLGASCGLPLYLMLRERHRNRTT
jgi:hypothetical protein